MPTPPTTELACPRTDDTLTYVDGVLRSKGGKVDYPIVNGIPWLFAEPTAALSEWRNRLHMAQSTLGSELDGLDAELKNKALSGLARRRVERYRDAVKAHQRKLKELIAPLFDAPLSSRLETYLALRTRLPSDQGLNTYYNNVHRDWCWGEEENRASLDCLRDVLQDGAELGRVLVIGAGGGRLAYDVWRELDVEHVVWFDFNPMLAFVAQKMVAGETLKLWEFPIAPASLEDDAVYRTLSAPEPCDERFELVLGDALRPPFPKDTFDTVLTPWLIDIVSEDLPVFAARINQLLKKDGRWLNFGSLAFQGSKRARCYSPEEVKSIVAEAGFTDPFVSQRTIPYMCSPASRHGRQEKVFTFAAYKEKSVKRPERHRALPDWIVTGKEPVPLSRSFRTQAMTTQIYSYVMSLIDGRRSIEDMAKIMEQQQLMTRAEAVEAIRNFLTRMYDDSQKSAGF